MSHLYLPLACLIALAGHLMSSASGASKLEDQGAFWLKTMLGLGMAAVALGFAFAAGGGFNG